jgi:xylulokinase
MILGVDIGTSSMKLGVFQNGGNDELSCIRRAQREYAINTYNNGLFNDIEQEKWKKAFIACCSDLGDLLGDIDVISLSGTTPGLTAMDGKGEALYPAILMLDQRSKKQAREIIESCGLDALLSTVGNYPVPGGCSLPSILWIKENRPEIYKKTAVFGHSNSYFAKWLTGECAIDPSSASLFLLYNTVNNDLTWNTDIADEFGIDLSKLPRLIRSYESPGRILPDIAVELGFTKQPHVVIGGNDATLAAYGNGIESPGDVVNVNGTCEISLVCLPRCIPSRNYNVRAHVLPGFWLTNYVLNAAGKAIEWFHRLFCPGLEKDEYYSRFIPEALDFWVGRESALTYVPYLMGSRYSLEALTAEFKGFTLETTREEMIAALIRGLYNYQREHLEEISGTISLSDTVVLTGGAVSDAMIEAKKRWMRDCTYRRRDNSSLDGAARLGERFLECRQTME